MDDFISVVFLNLPAGVIGDTSFGNLSDASFSSVSPPHIKSKHFIRDFALTGPTVSFPVVKPSPINNSCHMVLICPEVTKELSLSIFALDQPEEVDIAILFSKSSGITCQKHSLVQYVKICPFSPDSIFHSCTIHAVICPGLCMPIIFGLPFLKINDVVCDH